MTWVFLFAAFGAFMIALGQVFYLRNSKNRVAFFMYLNMAYVLVYFRMAFDGTLADHGHFYMTGNLAGLAAGCLIYFHVVSICDNSFMFGLRHMVLITAYILGYCAILIPFWLLPGQEKGALARYMISTGHLYGSEPLLAGVSVFKISNAYFGAVSTLAITLSWLRLARAVDRSNAWKDFYFYMLVIISIGVIATLIGDYGAYAGSVRMIEIIGGILGACIFGFYLVGQAFPWAIYERKLATDNEPLNPVRSHLRNADIGGIAAKLEDKLVAGRIFTESDLSLPMLAGAIGCTTHQLSEYLNKIKNTRFSAFVNSYRIAEARRIFEKAPDTTNLAVARACGFNSATHFHFVFQGITGMSPGEYRRSLRAR